MVEKIFPVNVFSYEPFVGEMVVIAEIEEFTNELSHLPGERSCPRYSFSTEGRETSCDLDIFANGFSESTKGHVCIAHYTYPQDLELCCVISVIDVLGNKRFSRSFIMREQENEIISYISRETLLSDPDELLPNDTLTLNISMPFNSIYEAMVTERFLRCLGIDNTFVRSFEKLQSFSLNMDSSLAMWLKEESSYFRRITSAEHEYGKVFHEDEFLSFQHIERIIMEEDILVFESVEEIFDLLFVAVKYDIPTVIESCRGFLKLYLSHIWYTINYYHIEKFIKRELPEEIKPISIDFDQEIERSANEIRLKEPIRGRQLVYFRPFQGPPFYFKFVSETEANTETFDFYN